MHKFWVSVAHLPEPIVTSTIDQFLISLLQMKDFFINFKSYLYHIGLWNDLKGENWQNVDFWSFSGALYNKIIV